MPCEFCDRILAASVLVRAAEAGTFPPIPSVAGAVSLVWQALEWHYGIRP